MLYEHGIFLSANLPPAVKIRPLKIVWLLLHISVMAAKSLTRHATNNQECFSHATSGIYTARPSTPLPTHTMNDPLSVTHSAISLATALKDLVEAANILYNIFRKVCSFHQSSSSNFRVNYSLVAIRPIHMSIMTRSSTRRMQCTISDASLTRPLGYMLPNIVSTINSPPINQIVSHG
ncbi:hypothetical protein CPC08DRAFT_460762 [Agrocybe pediades]|nr:hypothetical protein CPC08DRAFT_460762 [Agrocybe pediades]